MKISNTTLLKQDKEHFFCKGIIKILPNRVKNPQNAIKRKAGEL
jgi:hypothetical protein